MLNRLILDTVVHFMIFHIQCGLALWIFLGDFMLHHYFLLITFSEFCLVDFTFEEVLFHLV